MPQLSPSPWFMILTFTWTMLLIIIPPKVIAHITPNEPSPQDCLQPKTSPWTWPWY